MDPLIFLLRANIAFVILYGAYRLLLRGTPSFAANRAWLLLTPVVAFVLPLIELPSTVQPLGVIELPTVAVGGSGEVLAITSFHWSMWNVVFVLYGAGVLIALIILAVRYVQAWHMSRTAEGEALSFFGRIVLPVGLEGDEERSLVAHERVHVLKGHSYDVLYFELLAAISWWNPVWRWALRDLRTVHELQADAVASTLHPDYGLLLLSRALGVPKSTLVNSFRSSNLRTRIAMLNKKGSRFSGLKYAIAIPVLSAALLAVSCVKPEAPPLPPPPSAPAAPALPAQPVMDLSELDVQPEFPGGMEAVYAFMQKSVHYPEQALNENVQGKVYVQFTVDRDGKVKDVQLKRGLREDLNEEALRAVRAMPDWSPGSKDGQVVATRFVIPIEFRLDSTNSTGKD